MISQRAHSIGLSSTTHITSRAILMQRQGIDVINLSVGEPDLPTPSNIKDAASDAMHKDLTKYTLNKGLIELRQAIAAKLADEFQLSYDVEEIIVSNGAKQAIFNTLLSVLNKDDEVIIPAPYWVSYPEMVKLAEAKPVIVQTDEKNQFKITPRQLKAKINSKTKLFILCNPSNPTGTVYTRQELEDLAQVLIPLNILVISDEIYEKLVYENFPFSSIAAINSEIKENTILINGVSKAYSMTGWRIGYAAGNRSIIDHADKIQSHSTSCACTISQYASLEALRGQQDSFLKMKTKFEQRRNFLLEGIAKIKGMTCQKPLGAFYVFPNISSFLTGRSISTSHQLCEYLLQEARVAVVPGAAFGSDAHIRLSYANSIENIKSGIQRIAEALEAL